MHIVEVTRKLMYKVRHGPAKTGDFSNPNKFPT
jgi:hypothetical protein